MTIENRDPDGFGCYSDHEHDIIHKGACDWCGSTDRKVIGHVLPDTERLTGKDPVQAAAIVLHTKTMKIVDGVLLDYQTAGAIDLIYRHLKTDEGKAKLRAMTLERAGLVCWKLLNR